MKAIQGAKYNSAAFTVPSYNFNSQNKCGGNQPHVHVSIAQNHNIGIDNDAFENVAKCRLLRHDITSSS
jgi:hypothetical protein